jgi:hypothetical protein
MFDQALAATSRRARSVLVDHQLAAAEANTGRLELLDEIPAGERAGGCPARSDPMTSG